MKKIKPNQQMHPSQVVMIKAEIQLFQDGHFKIDTKARNGVEKSVVEALQLVLTNAISTPAPPKKEARPIAVTKTNLVEPKMPGLRDLRNDKP